MDHSLSRWKVNCNSWGEITVCRLLHIVDSWINTSTINQTEQKWTIVLEQSKCLSMLYQPEHCVCFSSPHPKKHHQHNLSRKKKKNGKNLLLGLKNTGPASVELRKWNGGLTVSPLGIALVFSPTPKEMGIPRKRKVCHFKTFHLLPNLINILLH